MHKIIKNVETVDTVRERERERESYTLKNKSGVVFNKSKCNLLEEIYKCINKSKIKPIFL